MRVIYNKKGMEMGVTTIISLAIGTLLIILIFMNVDTIFSGWNKGTVGSLNQYKEKLCYAINGLSAGKDSDGDGYPNSCDRCLGPDNNHDFDGDGIPDGCDPVPKIAVWDMEVKGNPTTDQIECLGGFELTVNNEKVVAVENCGQWTGSLCDARTKGPCERNCLSGKCHQQS